jgi:hypothetical protein
MTPVHTGVFYCPNFRKHNERTGSAVLPVFIPSAGKSERPVQLQAIESMAGMAIQHTRNGNHAFDATPRNVTDTARILPGVDDLASYFTIVQPPFMSRELIHYS